ncbi:hypothetical protein [Microbacterium karelineae]|uniref:hypothetical protein n=1 Tax=Microbacterium karelineae TaxID=2654283 RepID=UPI0027D26A41|nr:hypothetical protein [Microbacterium karelineae]
MRVEGGPGLTHVRHRPTVPGAEAAAERGRTDAYVKLRIAKPELGREPLYDLAALGERLAPEDMPSRRTYTVRSIDRARLWLSAYWAAGRAEDTFQAEKREPVGQIFAPES